MKINYIEFLDRFETSGLTQSLFGKQEGMSSSMVSYYVRLGRELREGDNLPKFSEVRLSSSNKCIKISYPSGLQVELPL